MFQLMVAENDLANIVAHTKYLLLDIYGFAPTFPLDEALQTYELRLFKNLILPMKASIEQTRSTARSLLSALPATVPNAVPYTFQTMGLASALDKAYSNAVDFLAKLVEIADNNVGKFSNTISTLDTRVGNVHQGIPVYMSLVMTQVTRDSGAGLREVIGSAEGALSAMRADIRALQLQLEQIAMPRPPFTQFIVNFVDGNVLFPPVTPAALATTTLPPTTTPPITTVTIAPAPTMAAPVGGRCLRRAN